MSGYKSLPAGAAGRPGGGGRSGLAAPSADRHLPHAASSQQLSSKKPNHPAAPTGINSRCCWSDIKICGTLFFERLFVAL